MKLQNYLQKQGYDTDVNEFRMLKLGLVDNKTDFENVIDSVSTKYDLDKNEIFQLRDVLNKSLKKGGYKGHKIFDFIIDDGDNLEELKIPQKKTEVLKKRQLELQELLTIIQERFEKNLKDKYL